MAIGGVSTGINSGLPISDLVTAMVNAEKAPKEAQLARLSTSTTTKLSGLGQLNSALGEFQTSLKDLNSATLFEKRTATSSNTSALTATAGKTASAGNYQVTVDSLASASKVATKALDGTFKSGAGDETLSVKLGESGTAIDVKITAGSDLASIRDQLNTALKGKGVTVSTINDPASGKSRLVFSGNETGEGKDVIVSGSGDLAGLSVDGRNKLATGDDSAAGFIVQAANAKFSIDGLALTSPTNSIKGAIADVSFELLAATEKDKPLTLKVGEDNAGVKAGIKKFVDAYNKLINTTNDLTRVTKVGEDGTPLVGGLVGDSTVRNLLGGIRNELVNPVGGDGVKVLADLGITTQKDGTLKIEDTKLDAALKSNFDAVGSFFLGDTGLAKRLDGQVAAYSQTGGILSQRMQALESTRTDIKKQTEDLKLRVDSMQKRLLAQFNAMDALVGQLNGTSSQLQNTLSSLPGVVKKSS
ncbi:MULTISPECIES: flagellar filament capping protein FliD [Pseudomonas]|uniref:Flagellar hook-associated protein 2 n=2 Tax=Pseudomonadaceae TaxID=135621 RepID=A0A0D0KYX0_9PSED|nr:MULTISPECIES: flagellar filament capping protein FliD [Pseudomonas]KIQ02570.1 A-type flagellar hook-associated protein 2 [Pseudomonas fulva]MCW2291629.1 flagellar hook-associated protein 2 [Pseudomonas sp. BIGb0408]NYH73800.1 flagellar hook-associated protein 2 [Pseudomonas flavescens]